MNKLLSFLNIKAISVVGLLTLCLLGVFIPSSIISAQDAVSQGVVAEIQYYQNLIDSKRSQVEKINELIEYYSENYNGWNSIDDDPIFKQLLQESGASDDGTGTTPYFFGGAGVKEFKINNWEADKKTFEYDILRYEEKIQLLNAQISGIPPEELESLKEDSQDRIKEQGKKTLSEVAELGIPAANASKNLPGCSLFNFNTMGCVYETLSIATGFMAWLTAMLAGFANTAFNWTIWISIVEFYNFANMPGVLVAWKFVRDVCNLFFIFILLYISISTIINSNSGVQKLLGKVIIVALIINFSAVVPRVVIDISNIFALQFYNAAGGGNYNPISGVPDISTRLVAGFDIGRYSDIESGGTPNAVYKSIIVSDLGKSISSSILIFILLSGAFMFLWRSVVLLFLIITSPFYFMGWIVPYLENHTKKWMNMLLSQSLFAPSMMFILLLVIRFVSAPQGNLKTQLSSLGGMSPGLVTFFYSVIVGGMLLGSFVVAKNMGAGGAKIAEGYGTKARKWATGGLAAGGGFALTRSVGRASNYLAKRDSIKNLEKKMPRLGGIVRRTVGAPANAKFGIAGASFNEAMKKKQELRAEGYKTFKTPEEKAAYLSNLSNKVEAQKVYEGLSPRERVELEEKAGTAHRDNIVAMKNKLSVEEREKTEKAQTEKNEQARKKALADSSRNNIDIVITEEIKVEKKDSSGKTIYEKNPDGTDNLNRPVYEKKPDGTPETVPANTTDFIDALKKIPPSQIVAIAQELKFGTPAEQTKSQKILENISVPQFKKLMKDTTDWSAEQIAGLRAEIKRMDRLGGVNDDVVTYAQGAIGVKSELGL